MTATFAPRAYYNEFDPYAAQWLRNLIAAGHIADGEVDSRSILDVSPDDLAGFTQCHFFAGIGVWSHALRSAGWPDDRPVWTGSCPCQPFSVAGVGAGMDDERHLWPYWFHLIEQCRPPVVFGEQVEAAIRHGWLDLVQADLEGIDYAFAASGIPAAGVGAPHIRQRLFFVADARDEGLQGRERVRPTGTQEPSGRHTPERGSLNRMGDAASCGRQRVGDQSAYGVAMQGCPPDAGRMVNADNERFGETGSPVTRQRPSVGCASGGMDDAERIGRGTGRHDDDRHDGQQFDAISHVDRTGPTESHWRDADWLFCRDGKWRPVEPGTFPLAHGAAGRVGRLRAYGNAIVSQVAQEVIAAYLECRP